MKCVVEYDFIIKYKCIMVLGSVNPHGSWYLPFWVIGWLYLNPVFSAFVVGGGVMPNLYRLPNLYRPTSSVVDNLTTDLIGLSVAGQV